MISLVINNFKSAKVKRRNTEYAINKKFIVLLINFVNFNVMNIQIHRFTY